MTFSVPATYPVILTLLVSVFSNPLPRVFAQNGAEDVPKYEFRGAWIATVLRLDWPKASTSAAQQAELITMLDELKSAGINAVMFQIRSESDAMYESDLEPWSYWLTGEQGAAPDPYYDPLQFAIDEAHARGMELHAWFNPYRAIRGSGYAQDPGHVSVTHAEWLLAFGGIRILNPGLPEVRNHVIEVVMDVVERYDIDGVHFDDYFYPYPPNQITDEDQETFETYGGDFDNIGDWRRNNVDLLIEQIHEAIESRKPHVKFGISPFGIWQNGVPPGIIGLDAYNVIYADAVNWLDQQWLDYLTPQLYWAFGGGQDYGSLAPWWAEHAARNERHLYPGHGLYKSDAATSMAPPPYTADEVPRQVRFNRNHEDISGSVFFRALNITQLSSKGFADSLRNDLYRYPALTPVMEWKDLSAPPSPGPLTFDWTADEEVTLYWSVPDESEDDSNAVRFAVYRSRAESTPDPAEIMASAQNLIAVTGDTSLTDRPGIAEDPYHFVVASVSRNSVESEPSNFITLEGRATSIEAPPLARAGFRLDSNYPNPFRERTEIGFAIRRAATATLRVFDVLGREVARLVDGERLAPGTYTVGWDGTDASGSRLPAGTYFGTLEIEGVRETTSMVVVR